jgi:excisionase family DNA binding protein
MKNEKMASAYLSTTQAAHRLGLSVGTVQRMVESGVLQAYTTQGGHRRILSASLNHYCRSALGTATGSPQVSVLSSPAHVTAELDALNLLDGLQVITNPLELAGIQDKVGVLFLDARIPWLPWADLHLTDSLGTKAHCIIYNCAHLPENSRTALQAQATLYAGDVSADLVQGYLLGHAVVTRQTPSPALGVGAETATDLLIKRH